MSEHEPSGRVAAFEAIVRLAIDEAGDGDSWGWGTDVDREDVERELRGDGPDVSLRTIDRALKDAAALDWLEDRPKGWNPGPRAEEVAADDEPEADSPL
jgi:hypothetical protein